MKICIENISINTFRSIHTTFNITLNIFLIKRKRIKRFNRKYSKIYWNRLVVEKYAGDCFSIFKPTGALFSQVKVQSQAHNTLKRVLIQNDFGLGCNVINQSFEIYIQFAFTHCTHCIQKLNDKCSCKKMWKKESKINSLQTLYYSLHLTIFILRKHLILFNVIHIHISNIKCFRH